MGISKMKMKHITAVKLGRVIAAVVLYVVVLLSVYIIHALYFRVNVVFYSAILDAFIAAAISGVIVYLVPWFGSLGSIEKAQLIVIWVLLGYGYAISVPTVLDRSLSFYLLEKIEQRGGGIKESAFPWIFVHEYMPEDHLVDIRLTEQLQSGTITIKHGCVLLTTKGKFLAKASKYFRNHFLPKHRLLMGKYTNVLTDPFNNNIKHPSYECK